MSGYRGLKSFRVNPVADVNLFLGRNNVGKTSVLEAVQLVRARSPISSLRANALRRREIRFLDPEAERAYRYQPADLSHAFWGHGVSPTSVISVLLGNGPKLELSVSQGEPDQPRLFEEGGPDNLLTAQRGADTETVSITREGILPEPARRPLSTPVTPDRNLFLTTDGLEGQRLGVLFNEVFLRGEEDLVVQALRILDEQVRGVHVLTNPVGLEPLILVDRNGHGRQPLGSFGDGMKRLLALALTFVNCAGGSLQVDEIDTGLHHGIMADMWTLVFGASQNNNVQVFATTHSYDCVRALYSALMRQPSQAARVAVHKIVADASEAISFSGDALMTALEHDVELR